MTSMFVILAGAIVGIALAVRVLYRASHPDRIIEIKHPTRMLEVKHPTRVYQDKEN